MKRHSSYSDQHCVPCVWLRSGTTTSAVNHGPPQALQQYSHQRRPTQVVKRQQFNSPRMQRTHRDMLCV
ncbi:hypothetical protein GN956_G19859 [Arapaima gigas]